MTLPPNRPDASAQALSTLTDTVAITRETLDPDWTPTDGPQTTITTLVWSGPGSLGHGTTRLSTAASPDRQIGTDRLRAPRACDGGPDGLQNGDRVTFKSKPGRTWIVAALHDRTTTVLQRITVVDARHAEQVPR